MNDQDKTLKAQNDPLPSPDTRPSKGTGGYEHPAHAKGAVKRARHLRREMTYSEKKLWAALKPLDLHIRRQAPIGKYIADFAHHAVKLVIEVDGARHDLPENQLHDYERDAWLQSQGYRVLRLRDVDVFADPYAIAQQIADLIKR